MIASLQIATAWKNKSILKHSWYTPPFKVANITEDPASGILQLMIMNSSPGVLDGDEYSIELKIKENTFLHLYTQSYQRLFTMREGASQWMNIYLEKNASFYYLPHPVVPHKESVFRSENTIFLTTGSELLWTEILTCGRKGCGEVFSFSRYHSLTRIYCDGKLVMKENILLLPATGHQQTLGQLEGYTHQASLIYWNGKVGITALIKDLQELLKDAPALSWGISALPVNGLLIRILGNAGEQLFDLMKRVALFIHGRTYASALSKINTEKQLDHAG